MAGIVQPRHIGGVEIDALGQIIGRRVIVVLQLEFLIEMVTVLGDIVFCGLGSGFAFFKFLLALGNLSSFGSLGGLSLVDSSDTVIDITFGAQQRVGFGQASLEYAVTDAHVELVDEVVVDLGIALGHLADEFLVSLLLCIELLQCLLVLLPGKPVIYEDGDVSGRICINHHVTGHPSKHRMPTVNDLTFHKQPVEVLSRT